MSGIIIGIDPGFEGAIAVLDDLQLRGPPSELQIIDMPTMPGAKGKTELNYAAVFTAMGARNTLGTTTVWLERVHSRPGQNVSGVFRFGQQFGALEMAAVAHGAILRYVTPKTWKAYFKLSADKDVARGEASRRFPHVAHLFARAKDDGRAEAALIALYGRENTK